MHSLRLDSPLLLQALSAIWASLFLNLMIKSAGRPVAGGDLFRGREVKFTSLQHMLVSTPSHVVQSDFRALFAEAQ